MVNDYEVYTESKKTSIRLLNDMAKNRNIDVKSEKDFQQEKKTILSRYH